MMLAGNLQHKHIFSCKHAATTGCRLSGMLTATRTHLLPQLETQDLRDMHHSRAPGANMQPKRLMVQGSVPTGPASIASMHAIQVVK